MHVAVGSEHPVKVDAVRRSLADAITFDDALSPFETEYY